ncbi:uncharacterized protein AB675_11290 [Cyphellophora attinorum]|uniref:Apple domain-containing protein n=1 Tax=Cyphellophora attinorum TaxID=1664694 RepID=A0A0N1H4B9_9EURO|nr:uncharacterized protein AB675_11290 [Phialophora attinorum]KPI40150.1 hypothetical protein AB675_11290 [Phialophora attinorum]
MAPIILSLNLFDSTGFTSTMGSMIRSLLCILFVTIVPYVQCQDSDTTTSASIDDGLPATTADTSSVEPSYSETSIASPNPPTYIATPSGSCPEDVTIVETKTGMYGTVTINPNVTVTATEYVMGNSTYDPTEPTIPSESSNQYPSPSSTTSASTTTDTVAPSDEPTVTVDPTASSESTMETSSESGASSGPDPSDVTLTGPPSAEPTSTESSTTTTSAPTTCSKYLSSTTIFPSASATAFYNNGTRWDPYNMNADIFASNGGTWDECIQKCVDNPQCVYFMYNSNRERCRLQAEGEEQCLKEMSQFSCGRVLRD